MKRLKKSSDYFNTKILLTAQHRQIVDILMNFFGIEPDYDLNIMVENQNPLNVTVRVLQKLEPIFRKEDPDFIIVQGDTTSAMAGALAAFYQKIPVAHVEAGLRTANRYLPYPEEMNRRLISQLSNIHFAANKRNKKNLIQENVFPNSIFITGNPVIDTLKEIINKSDFSSDLILPNKLGEIDLKNKIILLTTHRRENFGIPQKNILEAVYEMVKSNPEVEVVFPVHPNPSVLKVIESNSEKHPRIHLIQPLDYISFIRLMHISYFVMTDSGGIQEEAPALGKPILVLRETTERDEILMTGNAILVGSSKQKILDSANKLITNTAFYRKMSNKSFPFGKGDAASRIIEILKTHPLK
jgi:UDP-N-acetylglucosamine 2-epimerase (non-hydrolysing)